MSTDSYGSAGPSGGEDGNRSGQPGPTGDKDGDRSGQSSPATCYRHPGRETWLRCSRCDRPICPDCMNEATVGFQCPDCVRSGNRTMREGRTVFGGRVRRSTSRIAYALIGINVAVFIAELVVSGQSVVMRYGMLPSVVALGQWWRLITSAFLHAPGSIFHILFNMWALFVLGPPLEALLGRLRFATLYPLSALGGSALIYLVGPVNGLSIGASGAIFGLFGATFIVARRLNLDTRWILGLLAINLVITFTIPGISWQAHVGGLVTGLLLALAYAYAPRANRTLIHAAASAGMFLVIVAVCGVSTLMLT